LRRDKVVRGFVIECGVKQLVWNWLLPVVVACISAGEISFLSCNGCDQRLYLL